MRVDLPVLLNPTIEVDLPAVRSCRIRPAKFEKGSLFESIILIERISFRVNPRETLEARMISYFTR
jgi:hypothetical protein